MKIAVVLYVDEGMTDSQLAFKGDYLPEVLKHRLSAVPDSSVYYSVPAAYKGTLSGAPGACVRDDRDDISFWKRFFTEADCEHALKVYADSPFLDAGIVIEMLDLHRRYLAEFTYSENLPAGYACEIMSRELVQSVPDSKEALMPLGDAVRKNINQFDVELFYKDPDIRDKRLNFRSGDPREHKILENLAEVGGGVPPYVSVRDLIHAHPETLYAGPSYLEVELTGRCDLECIFCYRSAVTRARPDIDPGVYRKILSDMRGFGLPYSISLGGSGEPLMHGSFYELCDAALREEVVQNLVIETNAIYADDNFRSFIAEKRDPRIKVIANMNGYNGETYRTIHGKDYFSPASNHLIALREFLPGKESLYVQIMKINETEAFLDDFYDFWEKAGVTVLLQKQNTYMGRLKDRRYSDLSPLDRTPCWHLQRDLFILSDGRVAFCKQDIEGVCAKGDVSGESLGDIWQRALPFFLSDYRGEFPGAPDCASCDEWYTFNL